MAKLNFREVALKELSLSDLMKERDKMETEQLIALHPDRVTIKDFDIFELSKNGKSEIVCCFITLEEPKYFIFGGKIIKELFETFIKAYDCDIEACREEFKQSGGLTVRFERGKTKDGNTVTNVRVI